MPEPRGSRLRLIFLVLGLALFFGCLEAAQGRYWYAKLPGHRFWPEALARTLPSWLILAALFPMIYTLSRRFPVDARKWPVSLPVHIFGALAFTALHLTGSAWIASLRGVTVGSFDEAAWNFFSRYTVTDFFMYGALAGIVQIAHQTGEIRRREQTLARLQADLAEARLAALRNQLNPHFLFNTLNSISALALTGDRETLVRAVDALSGLLRIVLNESGGATTSLSVEIEFLDRYCEIQAIRFGNRLVLEREVEDAALLAEVPTLVLQPLVENAVTHGVGASPGPGRVMIRARREQDWLHLEVADSGPGFRDPLGTAGSGLGLAITRARLSHLYGESYEFDCRNPPEGGALVVIRIPWSQARLPETLRLRA